MIVMLVVLAAIDADPDVEIARRHFEAGTAEYNAGRYAAAIVEFEAARKVKALPAFDFNIARCHDRLEHVREAIDAYERYAATAPSDVIEVRARVAVLRQRLAPPATPTASPPASSVVVVSSSPAPRRVATWIVGGAGAVLLAGSLVAGLVANDRYSDLKNKCVDGRCGADMQGTIDSGRSAAVASDVLLGVGAAAVVAGVVLFFVEGRHPVERWQVAPTVGAHSAGLSLTVSR